MQTSGFLKLVKNVFDESAYLKETKKVVNTLCVECEEIPKQIAGT